MRRGEDQTPARVLDHAIGLVDQLDKLVQRHGRDHRLVRDRRPVREMGDALLALDADERLVELEALGWQGLVDRFPDAAGPAVRRKAEGGVRAPAARLSFASANQERGRTSCLRSSCSARC
jgi:hypothetical protein